ncbi:hypothetical protein F5B20DRAFT_584637 [Whalleya microplaca]|nr:hypothetical protein F5B20DRAFT_584637 [Whalleya microplaca]
MSDIRNLPLSSVEVASDADLRKIWGWNATLPKASTTSIHELIAQRVQKQPNALAVNAWDGDWTYRQLDEISTHLARRLIQENGIGPKTIVPLLFEKSRWTSVAALAVMKAGGASVALDISQPEERWLSIVDQASPDIILSSSSMQEQATRLARVCQARIQVVDERNLQTTVMRGTRVKPPPLPAVRPDDWLYLVFTSGSTGQPKGVIITHGNFSSAIKHQQQAHGFEEGPVCRVYDFASYAFDVSWSNILHTLTCGGTLCVPSEIERKNDLVASIKRFGTTHLDITPSIARLIPDSTLRGLKTMVLGGESLPADCAERWSSLVTVKNPFGPSECTPTATIATIQPGTAFKGTIGRGLGVNAWVVDAENADSLVPVGSVGELWLEGPLVGAGYLGDAAKTAAAFVENPSWLRRGLVLAGYHGRRGRLYKTGDLVRYDGEDGSLIFVGRKDTQVKINGQRVELGEVEHHVKAALPEAMDVRQVVAEVVVPTQSSKAVLVACLEMGDRPAKEWSALIKEMTPGLYTQLRAQVPAYMIPSAYIPLASFPLTPTGKTDRRRLRGLAEKLSLAMDGLGSENRSAPLQPTTQLEADLLKLWESVLGMQSGVMGIDDSFLRLGGDSIAAMKLVGAAREMNIDLTVADIFMHPQLQDMAKVARTVASDNEQPILPYSLLQISEYNRRQAVEEAARNCGVHISQIEDIFPCTPLQEGLLALTAKRPGDYVVRYSLELAANVDHQRLQSAWEEVMTATPILRTRIVNLHGCGLVQVVINEPAMLPLLTEDRSEGAEIGQITGLNSPLANFHLKRQSGKTFFIWTMHHAVFDGWSISLIIDKLDLVYRGKVAQPSPPFQRFVKHIQTINEGQAKSFWAAQFDGLAAEAFPGLPWPDYQPKPNEVYSHDVSGLNWLSSTGITASSIVRAAFSLLISAYSGSPDVVFGATVAGRQAAVPGVEQMTGPTIATLPVRVAVDSSKTIDEFLMQVQNQSIQATPFEQLGLQRIRRVSANAERACQFQTLLVVQPAEDEEYDADGSVFPRSREDLEEGDANSSGELDTYAVTLECHLSPQGAQFRVAFDSAVLSRGQVTRIVTSLEHIVRQLCTGNPSIRLSAIQTTSPADIRTIWAWNRTVPTAADVCVHELFVKTALRQPAAPAVAAWDGDWTYSQLHALSTRLARHLATLDVAGSVVPLLFEKSKWMPVAVLGVMKAGGACLALDSELPTERLRFMVQQAAPVKVILSSRPKKDFARSLVEEDTAVEIVDTNRILALTQLSPTSATFQRARSLPVVRATDRLYVIFTSGSTGTPKGVVITHANFSSAIRYQQEAHGFKSTSRVYDFASYSFDVSWSNILHTLTCGGCLCVPSDTERKSDLAGSIERLQVTHLDLTPSIARILPLRLFPRLDTMVLGGEKLLEEDAERWAPLVTVKNPYGPCECTPTATLTTIDASNQDSFKGSIGKGLGLNTWLIDPSGESLAPIGSIGELWLEGPLVGSGYLGSPEKTAAVFIDDPPWLVRGGRRGRVYRTGDLARYNDDGTLTFIGRKDAQVKIHGQRMELGEIEGHMARLSAIRQAACLLPSSGPCANRLVAVFSLQRSRQEVRGDANSTAQTTLFTAASGTLVDRYLRALQSLLSEALPTYMVPTVWVALEDIPLNAAGKLDRRSLQTWLSNIDAKTYAAVARTEDEDDEEVASSGAEIGSSAEKALRDACGHILNTDPANINMSRSFISNGGDSISAMRLSAECRATASLVFSVADLLKGKSLAAFAKTLKVPETPNESTSPVEEVFDVDFALSPIQQWFITQYPNQDSLPANGYGNQGFYLKLTRSVALDDMVKAVATIVDTHSMLRARFHRTEAPEGEDWMQRVPRPGTGLHQFSSLHLPSFEDIKSLARERHASLDIRKGPVFIADFCILPSGEQYLLLIAHHFVIDLVSWRIILDDLETLLNGGSIRPVSLTFQQWTQVQAKRASELDIKNVLSTDGIHDDLDFWNFTPGTPNTVGDHDVHQLDIDQHTTNSVLSSETNSALNTEPVDLLISAVWDAFLRVFPEREGLTIFSEGHGRELWSTDIDLSRTVGWFTTISPVNVSRRDTISGNETEDYSVTNTIRFVKDARRRLPANGWEYFTTRYLHPEGRSAFKSHNSSPAMEVVFNYHGQFQQLEGGASLFENVELQGVSEQGPALPAGSLFGIEVSIEGGRARYSFSFNRHLGQRDRIVQWVEQIGPSLSAICDKLASSAPSQTLCDYEFLKMNYKTLDDFHGRVVPAIEELHQSGVEDVMPCSPTVDGILLSQVRQPEAYKTLQLYEISSAEPVSADRLIEAWQHVVARQPSLRSIFVPGLDSSAAFNQVILKNYHAEVIIVDRNHQTSRDGALSALKQLPPVDYQQEFRPPHRVALCQVDNNTVLCQVEMSHAITDGASTAIIGQDWIQAYAGTLKSSTTADLVDTTRAFARSLAAQPIDKKMTFWKTKLQGAEPCHFPKLSGNDQSGDLSGTVCARIDGSIFQEIQDFCTSQSITVGSVMNSAWALTLSAYTGSSAVCFGYLASGRDLPIEGLDESIGAYANMMISYVDVHRDLDAATFVRQIHDQTMRDLDYQYCSLAGIQHELGLPAGRALFNTIVSFQKTDEGVETNDGVDGGLRYTVLDGEDPTEYDIVMNIGHGSSTIDLVFDFSPSCLSHSNAERVLSLFQKIASALASGELTPASNKDPKVKALGSMDLASDDDLHDIWAWNNTVPSTANDCIHHMISETTRRHPDNQAVCAWDGEFTYAELDSLSTRLAYRLVDLGVGRDVIVPLCLEKSKWTPVAMLAVMKTGGASVAMDAGQPVERLRSIVRQVDPVVVLCSASKSDLASQLAEDTASVQVVDQEHLLALPSQAPAKSLPDVRPSDTLYLVFTSGSTGVPKGVVISHANIASAIRHQRDILGLTPASRVYDFSGYMFDVVWCNMYQALSIGGCLCIPGDHDRKSDFIGAVDKLSADVVIFTPSTIRGLEAGALNKLRNLHFIGEPLYVDAFQQIDPRVKVTNLYGPSECTTFATAQPVVGREAQSIGIGNGFGLNTWIVEPTSGQSLMPIGGIGELWLEGPLVASGYLGDAEKTANVFIDNPAWLSRGVNGRPGRQGRLYKTGDLVRYDEQGHLQFMGRKDTQVKINGQRVELGEVEANVRAVLDQAVRQVIAEVITPQQSGHATLVSFIELSAASPDTPQTELFKLAAETTSGMDEKIASLLPAHMTPSFYVPISSIPVTATGKTDRKRLREIGAALTLDMLDATRLSDGKDKRPPSTEMEKRLQALWATVLKIDDLGRISADDSFLRIGGDSIAAMRLVGAARTSGVTLTVADVFRHPKLSDLAVAISEGEENEVNDGSDMEAMSIERFSLLKSGIDAAEAVRRAATALVGVKEDQIEDMYPCTPLQEGMLALTLIRPGEYIAKCALELRSSVDINRFRQAWDSLVASTPILRTRIVDLSSQGLVQVVINELSTWSEEDDDQQVMALGTPLFRVRLVKESDKHVFLLTIHHALYDGWSLGLLFDRLEAIYLNSPSPPSPVPDYRAFVKYVTNVDRENALGFWRQQLRGLEAETFPPLPSPSYQPNSDKVAIYHIDGLRMGGKTDVTLSTAIRAAFSLVIADYSNENDDVVFGVTVTGRQTAVPGIEDMVGPTIATVPIRISVDREEELQQFLSRVQMQSIEMTPFEQMGLQRIRRLGPDAERACNFQTLLIVQPADEAAEWSSEIIARDIHEADENSAGGEGLQQQDETYALTVECHLEKDDSVRLRIGYDSAVLKEKQVQRLAQQFKHMLHQICSSEDGTMAVAHLQTLNSDDSRDIWSWNATVPETVDVCVHNRISAMSFQLPDKLAVCAWDGDWTYHELDSLSTHLAFHLRRLGVDSETIVPLVFEKSKWTPVAMLGVMKAGGASVLVDTAQPEDRLRAIIQQVSPIVVLSSVAKHELAGRIAAGAAVQAVNEAGLRAMNLKLGGEWPILPRVSPSSRLYLVFTSGSTGTPKGVVITHANFSSALTHQREAQGISSSTRLFDFASYAFDVAWANTLTAFECGATLCIPSDADRKDDLNGAIAKFKPTHLDVTPSAALVLSPESLRQLNSLTLGGERLTAEWARRWAPHVSLKNSYGPSECTPTATFSQVILPDGSFAGSIGSGTGLNTWVVDAATGNSLVPIGSSGELWLEGPLVGAGYLDDETKTASVFVENPPWLLQGNGTEYPGRQGRLYKTGDLVRYNQDGSLTFIGRKDTQVKINGQRVELSEIESHMARHDDSRQTVCLIPSSGPCAKRMVGFFSLRNVKRESTAATNTIDLLADTEHSKSAERHIKALETLLSETLPSYMVPSIWVPLRDLPETASGKLDRKELNIWLTSMDVETFNKIANADGQVAQRKPRTNAERLLMDATSRVLNMASADIDLGRSFIANGGDSISAMRLSSQWRAATNDGGFSVAALLKSKSLAEFAQTLSAAAGTMAGRNEMQEEVEVPFGLSPIQQWFFEQLELPESVRRPEYYYNQGFYVKMTSRTFSVDEVAGAVKRLVNHHSMLRAQFQRVDGTWMQSVSKVDKGAYRFAAHQVSSLNQIESIAMKSHTSINIEQGQVFSVDLCNMTTSGDQYLILVAHHLVIDLVSWRILLDDLETLLSGGTVQSSLPFQTWTKLQEAYVSSSSELSPEKLLSTKDLGNDTNFWGFTSLTPNNNNAHDIRSIEIDRETTSLLLGPANDAYNTEPVELLLSAVWDAFLATFPQRHGLTIFSEGHGREPWAVVADTVDLSRTVGWFTTMSPISVSRDVATNAANMVRLVKDARRQLPANGWAYFASRYLNPQGRKAFEVHNSTMEVTFNYHGQFQELENEESFFKDVTLSGVSEQGSAIPVSSLFNIEVSIEGGQAQFEFSFNRHIKHQSYIQQWISQVGPSLRSICKEMVDTRSSSSRTLCDYEFLTLDYPVLDDFQTRFATQIESLNGSAIEEVYPCTPTVDGILLSQTRQASSYKTVALYEIISHDDKPIDINNLTQSWQKVVAHQPALRSIFIGGLDASSAFNQVVLKTYQGEVVVLPFARSTAAALEALSRLPEVDYTQLRPPHRVALVPTPNKVVCQIEMSHAVTDGTSSSILTGDWISAYNNTLSSTDLLSTTSGFVRALKAGKTKDEKLTYWKTKLAGVEPCHFPALAGGSHSSSDPASIATTSTSTVLIRDAAFAAIQKFCSAPSSVTPASLLQSAWARTLSAYISSESGSVVFGYLCSGRDLPVAGIDESVGAYANMMICRAEVKAGGSHGLVQGVHEQIMQDLDYQHCSLAEIQHELGATAGKGMFNSIVSFQRVEAEQEDGMEEGLSFESLDGLDPTEYEIVLGINYAADHIEVELEYADTHLTDEQANRVLSLFQKHTAALIAEPNSDRDNEQQRFISDEDTHDIWNWNATVPTAVERCMHDLITDTARRNPTAPAICAWDGDFTYGQMEDIATRLAQQLVQRGVGSGNRTIIPLCFEKSKWTPIAILAVMKAGGTCVTMDTAQPEERLRGIVRQAQPDKKQQAFILCSSANQGLASRLADSAELQIVDEGILTLPKGSSPLPVVSPSTNLYVVFTSGSTGVPKGVMISHTNYSSAVLHQQAAHGFTASSRVYDFASYAFDVSWSNFLHTLSIGACLCIPSDEDRRNDLVGSIKRLNATHVDVTPSVARLLPAETLQKVQTLVLGGEKVPDEAKNWAQLVIGSVKNPYGPSECTPTATITEVDPHAPFTGSIGRGIGVNTWVVDVDGQSLVPIGSTGELWLEGPLVGNGYLGDSDKTAAAFVTDPEWLLHGVDGRPGRHGRLYRTGDLVRYSGADGSLVFVGRKDMSQVKINGQRVELGEVEYHVQACIPEQVVSQVVAEVVTPRHSGNAMLVAFLETGSSSDAGAIDASFGLGEKLSSRVPIHMIPSAYIPLEKIPLTANGKTDRKRLQEMGKDLTRAQLRPSGSSESGSRGSSRPATAMEKKLQYLWAAALKVDPQQIETSDSFFRMGGDSIVAMRLVTAARDMGLSLSVADILKNPKLDDMARVLQPLQKGIAGQELMLQEPIEFDPLPYEPFSLLPRDVNTAALWRRLPEYGIMRDAVHDILPVTDQQARLISLTYTANRGMLLYHTLDGHGAPDVFRMRAVCRELIQRFDMLRTVFVAHGSNFLQVVLRDLALEIPVLATNHRDLEDCVEDIRRYDNGRASLRFGSPLAGFAIIHQTRINKWRLVARMSHAQHDGMSLLKMWSAFEELYNKHEEPFNPPQLLPPDVDPRLTPPRSPDISAADSIINAKSSMQQASFSQHMLALNHMDKQAAHRHWRNLLKGSSPTVLRPQPSHTLRIGEGPCVVREIPRATLPPCDYTFSTVLKAAWAYVLARAAASDDIVFSTLTHGRGLQGSQEAFGPCVNIVPTRVKFQDGWRATDLMSAVHTQHVASMPFEQLGSREIVRECTDWPRWMFAGSVVYHHNFEDGDGPSDDVYTRSMHEGEDDTGDAGDVDNVDVHVTSKPSEDGKAFRIELSFAVGTVSDRMASLLLSKLCETISLFHRADDMPLPSRTDLKSLAASLPQAVNPGGHDGLLLEPTTEEVMVAELCPEELRDALVASWAEALGCKVEMVPRADDAASFFDLGGDIVCASVLSAHMQRQGYDLSVEDVLENPIICQQLGLLAWRLLRI